jgi:hypothetical protein
VIAVRLGELRANMEVSLAGLKSLAETGGPPPAGH